MDVMWFVHNRLPNGAELVVEKRRNGKVEIIDPLFRFEYRISYAEKRHCCEAVVGMNHRFDLCARCKI